MQAMILVNRSALERKFRWSSIPWVGYADDTDEGSTLGKIQVKNG
jgi:hypothetical protein